MYIDVYPFFFAHLHHGKVVFFQSFRGTCCLLLHWQSEYTRQFEPEDGGSKYAKISATQPNAYVLLNSCKLSLLENGKRNAFTKPY
jgi:hypothetical protein